MAILFFVVVLVLVYVISVYITGDYRKSIVITLIVMVLGWALLLAAKFFFGWQVYDASFVYLSEGAGIEPSAAKLISFALAIFGVIFAGWLTSCLLFGKKVKEVVIFAIVIITIAVSGIYYFKNKVFFNRNTGDPARYVTKTDEGFSVSAAPGYDSRTGKRLEQVTPELKREIEFWEKNSGKMTHIIPGKYFNAFTGDPEVWYIIKKGKVELFPRPGFDEETGKKLTPIEFDIIERYEKEKRLLEEAQQKKEKETQRKLEEERNIAEEKKKKDEERKIIEENQRKEAEAKQASKVREGQHKDEVWVMLQKECEEGLLKQQLGRQAASGKNEYSKGEIIQKAQILCQEALQGMTQQKREELSQESARKRDLREVMEYNNRSRIYNRESFNDWRRRNGYSN